MGIRSRTRRAKLQKKCRCPKCGRHLNRQLKRCPSCHKVQQPVSV
jgi:hypothetical protein